MPVFCLTGKKVPRRKDRRFSGRPYILHPVEKGIEKATLAISLSELSVQVT